MNALPDPHQADRDEQAAIWCLDIAQGELPRHEQEAFDRWIADPANAAAFEDAARVWNTADAVAEMPELIQMRGAALENFRRANKRRWAGRLPTAWYWGGSIAAVLLLALLTTMMLRVPTQVYQTGIGERRIAVLEDGSKLSLDADTEVDVRLSRNRRELALLRGRAKFDVAKDPLRPFTVTAGDKMVVATGTSFSVELLDRRVHVLLYEGHVAVLEAKNERSVPQRGAAGGGQAMAADQALTPGRELVASIGVPVPATVTRSDPSRSLLWESGQLSFDDEPLSSAVARMNRYSTEQLAIDGPDAAQLRVNGVFTAGDTDAFIEGVTALNPVHVVREGDRIVLAQNASR
jgi:transmembrane sensor